MGRQIDGSMVVPVTLFDSAGNPISVSQVGGSVSIADGADTAEGTTTDSPWVSGAGTVIALLKKIASGGGSAVSIADGADVVEGALADAAIVTDVAGTVSGKLRGIVKLLAGTLTIAGTVTANIGTIAGIATEATLALIKAKTDNLDVALSSRTKPSDQQHTILDSQSAGLALDATVSATQPRDVTDRAARLLGHVTTDSGSVVNASVVADTVGLLKDATFQAAIGTASINDTGQAAYGTVLYQLQQLNKALAADATRQAAILAAIRQITPAKAPQRTTLLHGR